VAAEFGPRALCLMPALSRHSTLHSGFLRSALNRPSDWSSLCKKKRSPPCLCVVARLQRGSGDGVPVQKLPELLGAALHLLQHRFALRHFLCLLLLLKHTHTHTHTHEAMNIIESQLHPAPLTSLMVLFMSRLAASRSSGQVLFSNLANS